MLKDLFPQSQIEGEGETGTRQLVDLARVRAAEVARWRGGLRGSGSGVEDIGIGVLCPGLGLYYAVRIIHSMGSGRGPFSIDVV